MSIVFFLGYSCVNGYVGIRIRKNLIQYVPELNSTIYWLLYGLFYLSYPGMTMGKKFLPFEIYAIGIWIGLFWLGIIIYLFLFFILIDLGRAMGGRWNWRTFPWKYRRRLTTIWAIFLLVFMATLFFIGFRNAGVVREAQYEIVIAKTAKIRSLKLVMVSDVHLDLVVDGRRFQSLIRRIKANRPDLVLFLGDTIDSDLNIYQRYGVHRMLESLHPKYGVYAVVGNHEYYGGPAENDIRYLKKGGVQVLRDRAVKIAGSFYLIGRDDKYRKYLTSRSRKNLNELMSEVDRRLPVILLDHQPVDFNESERNGVDLQLSGHTHAGQIFPINGIIALFYKNQWGYMRQGNLQIIVSSGYGTLGPPIRIGTYPEIIKAIIHF